MIIGTCLPAGLISMILLVAPQMTQPTQAEIKATLLFRFTAFVQWPSSIKDKETFELCILGNTEGFGDLIAHYDGRKIKGKPLKIKTISRVEDIGDAQLLFINIAEEQIPSVLAYLQDKPVLTVGDRKGLGQMGMMINFFEEAETVKFEINPGVAKNAGLKIASKLLRIAKIVGDI